MYDDSAKFESWSPNYGFLLNIQVLNCALEQVSLLSYFFLIVRSMPPVKTGQSKTQRRKNKLRN
jgi:hypothetical protein